MVSCLGSLVQSCCGGGRGTADKYHWRVWGALPVFRPHWLCPCSVRVCYTAHTPGCSPGSRPCAACGSRVRVRHKSADSVGPAFCAFPAQAAQGTRSLRSAFSSAAARLLPSPSQPRFPGAPTWCALCLFWGADLWLRPSQRMSTCQPSRISGSLWLETGSLYAVW